MEAYEGDTEVWVDSVEGDAAEGVQEHEVEADVYQEAEGRGPRPRKHRGREIRKMMDRRIR